MAYLNWTGISTPFRIENGSVARSSAVLTSKREDLPHIEESIRTIVKTTIGEIMTQPEIGTKFRRIVFDLFNVDFDTYIEYNLTESIQKQDKRVIIQSISIDRNNSEHEVSIKVEWGINPTIVRNFGSVNGYTTMVVLPNTNNEVVNKLVEGEA